MADGKVEVEIELDDTKAKRDAGRAGKDAGDSYAKGMTNAVKGLAGKLAGLVALQEVAQGFADLTKQAVDAYAEYEQLAGGVAKIFDQADQAAILEDANRAYLDLNLSANDYLAVINQTGAAFAATMGDQAGYDAARKGMLAISDYASGTGRSIEELSEKFALITRSTSSYQSIADQFSGILPATSADFLDQAQAAGILSDEYTKLTEVPIAEYQQAVTEMLALGVEQMGLAGNTAAETASTVSGSLMALTAQWENWLVAIGSGEGVTEATNGLVEAIGVAAQNVVPVLSTILTTLKDMFVQALRDLVNLLISNDPEMHARAYEMFMKIVSAVGEIAPLVLAALGMMIVNAIGVLIHAAADFFMQGVALVGKVAEGVGNAAGQVKDEFVQGVRDAWNGVKSWASSFWSAGGSLIDGLIGGVKAKVGQLASAAASAAHSALAAAKSALGIASPSKEFEFVGNMSMDGWINPLEKRRKELAGTVRGIASDMLSAATPRFSMAGATSTTTTYTFGDVYLNASDAYGITAIEQLVELIETA